MNADERHGESRPTAVAAAPLAHPEPKEIQLPALSNETLVFDARPNCLTSSAGHHPGIVLVLVLVVIQCAAGRRVVVETEKCAAQPSMSAARAEDHDLAPASTTSQSFIFALHLRSSHLVPSMALRLPHIKSEQADEGCARRSWQWNVMPQTTVEVASCHRNTSLDFRRIQHGRARPGRPGAIRSASAGYSRAHLFRFARHLAGCCNWTEERLKW